VLNDITEPILGPIRRILPPLGGIDLSPLVAIILIQVISNLLLQALSA
jgi:YggT family protein